MTEIIIEVLIKIAVLVGGLLTAVAYLVLLERRVAAWIQDRRGPNRVGIPLTKISLAGLGQPLADGLKFLLKEELTPEHVDKKLFTIAPIVIFASALLAFAVVPFGNVQVDDKHTFQLVVAPGMDVGILFMFAMSGLAVYGVIIGGWASNNKYSFLGGLRASAQLISYEIPLGLGILGVVLVSGSLRLDTIIDQQTVHGWNFFAQPLGLAVFFVAALAEAARLPFDLPECEQELIGGYHTEYAGMKLSCFLIAEFMHMVTAAFLLVMLYFGGWHLPLGLTGGGSETVGIAMALFRVLVLLVKVMAVILLIMLIRWSWPRFRFDQLMDRAWKVMLPLGMVNLVVVACCLEFFGSGILTAIVGWGVAFGSLVVTAMLAPLETPRRSTEPLTKAVS